MSDPFAPPDAVDDASVAPVLGGWMLAFGGLGACIGALGVVLGVVGHMAWGAAPGGLLGLGLGVTAVRWERRRAAARTAVMDARGRLVRPLGSWLTAVPVTAGVVALSGFVVVGALISQSRAVAGAFGLLAVGLLALFRPLFAGTKLRVAVEAASRGERDEAALRAVATAWWSTGSTRRQAALNLGLLALRRGEYEEALRWYGAVAGGRAAGFASTGAALAHIGMGRLPDAEAALLDAASSEAGRHVQTELDGARLLLVLRSEGSAAALELAERLSPPAPGALFDAVRTVASGADAREARARLDEVGLTHLLPELCRDAT